ncbi:MAG: hypothetical protein N4A47_05065 [Clostridia bacterium]|jgi:Tfp pilus assembly protein FimT|nr:hypothetical protein [Clostridia bacterium]
MNFLEVILAVSILALIAFPVGNSVFSNNRYIGEIQEIGNAKQATIQEAATILMKKEWDTWADSGANKVSPVTVTEKYNITSTYIVSEGIIRIDVVDKNDPLIKSEFFITVPNESY